MQIYRAKIRLAGSLFNEVLKADLTAAEITVLRRMHGPDAIVDIANVGSEDRTDEEERARLQGIYGKAVMRNEHIRTLDAILGVPGVPLPSSIPGVDTLPAPKTGKRVEVKAPAPVEPILEEAFT